MSPPELHEWFVTTPEYETVEDRIDGYTLYGTGRDWEQVQARTAREAVQIAVREWLDPWVTCLRCAGSGGGDDGPLRCITCWGRGIVRDPMKRDNYCASRKADALCPWTGVRADIAECPHGVEMPLGFEDDFWCDECQAEWDRECAEADA